MIDIDVKDACTCNKYAAVLKTGDGCLQMIAASVQRTVHTHRDAPSSAHADQHHKVSNNAHMSWT